MTDEEIDMLWICRPSIHNGDLMPQLRDFARAVLKASADHEDAERYRWLRDNKYLDIWWSVAGPKDRCANIDADIDEARLNN